MHIVNQCVAKNFGWKVKKYFAGLEKGCTFASVFRQSVRREGRQEKFETDEKKEIACVSPVYNKVYGRTRRRVKKVKSNSYNEEFDPGSG